jgi:3,4-dihydroxy 2-butanone 4-phosphate synthase/GTP cyclohydrolase II
VNPSLAKGYASDFPLIQLGGKLSSSIKGVGRTRATVISGEGDLLSYANEINVEENSTLIGDQSVGIEIQPDAVTFGTLAADTIPTSSGFPVDNDEFDLDRPTEGFSSIPEAIEDIRQGKVTCFLSFVLLRDLLANLLVLDF